MLNRVAEEKRGEYLKSLSQYCEKKECYDLISEAISRQQRNIECLEESKRQLEAQNRSFTETAEARITQLEEQNREITETAETRQARITQLEEQNHGLSKTVETRQARITQLEEQNREITESPALFAYYKKLQKERKNVRVVTWQGRFNYSAINNFGAKHCTGDYLLLLNNDTEVITPNWIEEMLMFAQRSDVGAVGAMLYYPDKTIQHAGVCLGMGGVAGHYFASFPHGHVGYMGNLLYGRNMSAVTAACMLLRREVWNTVGGLDENWAVAFNDVDLCMRIRQAGFLIVWTPFAELYHYESKSRGFEDTQKKQERFQGEVLCFQQRWERELAEGDPYFNPNFLLDRSDFSVKPAVQQYDAR